MESDIYRQIIQELSERSEKDYGFKRIVDEGNKFAGYIKKIFFVLLQLIIIAIASTFFAIRFIDNSSLIINLNVVSISVAILGVINYPFLWRKFTRKYIVLVILIVSVLFALRIAHPVNLISQIDNNLPFWVSWSILISLISFVIYFFSNSMATLAEILLDLASVFLPVLPTTFGGSLHDLKLETYKIIYKKINEKPKHESDLKYLIAVSQADIDSAGIRSLPWVVLLGLGATVFSGIFTGTTSLISVSSFLGFPLLLASLFAVFNTARMTYFQTLIIQVSNQLLLEIYERNNKDEEKSDNYLILTENNKVGCLLKILFPWKKSG